MNINYFVLPNEISKIQATILTSFYSILTSIPQDPISTEIQIERIIIESSKLGAKVSQEMIVELNNEITLGNLDMDVGLIRILPDKYSFVIEGLKDNLEKIVISLFNESHTKSFEPIMSYNENFTELTQNLRKVYNNAPRGDHTIVLNLFGIKYSKNLIRFPIDTLTLHATGKKNLWMEVRKGIKLSDYVDISFEGENLVRNLLKKT